MSEMSEMSDITPQMPVSGRRDKLDVSRLVTPEVAARQLEELRQRTAEHIRHSKSEATLRAYRSDFSGFELWCRRFGLSSLPAEPDTVALYLTACGGAGAALSTLRRRLVAISQAPRASGLPSPTQAETVRRTIAGLARTRGSRPHQVAPIRAAGLRAMLEAPPRTTSSQSATGPCSCSASRRGCGAAS
jgi:hypothetical protein